MDSFRSVLSKGRLYHHAISKFVQFFVLFDSQKEAQLHVRSFPYSMKANEMPTRPRKKKRYQKSKPTSADEYLAVGVELEEAAEKWRAGDSVKSIRFYKRALQSYEEGLQKFPGAFDVAYNK